MKDEMTYQQNSGLDSNQQRWQQVLAFGCLAEQRVSSEARPVAPSPAAFVVLP
jgi:hypothetical protein